MLFPRKFSIKLFSHSFKGDRRTTDTGRPGRRPGVVQRSVSRGRVFASWGLPLDPPRRPRTVLKIHVQGPPRDLLLELPRRRLRVHTRATQAPRCEQLTLRKLIIVPPLTNRPHYQILPHTDSYFHCLYSYLDLLQSLLGKKVWIAVKTVKVAIGMG